MALLSELIQSINILYECPLEFTQKNELNTTLCSVSDLLSLEGSTLPHSKEARYSILQNWTKSLWRELKEKFENAYILEEGGSFLLNSGDTRVIINPAIGCEHFSFSSVAVALKDFVTEVALPIYLLHISKLRELDTDILDDSQVDIQFETQPNQKNLFNVLGGFNEGVRQVCAILDAYLAYEVVVNRDIPSTYQIQKFLDYAYGEVVEITKLNFWADKFFDAIIELGGNPYQCESKRGGYCLAIKQEALDGSGEYLKLINQALTGDNIESNVAALSKLLLELTEAPLDYVRDRADKLIKIGVSYYLEPENRKTIICPATTSGVLSKWYGELSRLLVEYYQSKCGHILKV